MRARALIVLAAFAAAGCGSTPDTAPRPGADQAPYFEDLALPASKPVGLTDVQLERFADPERDGQRAMLVFEDATVYVCTRPIGGAPEGATPCPYPEKQDLFSVASGPEVETVYAVDAQSPAVEGKAGSPADTEAIRDVLDDDVEMQVEPAWFVELIEGNHK
jgi:hypothetical protein